MVYHLHRGFSNAQWKTCCKPGVPHTVVYLDDILITGRTEEERLRNLAEVLKRLREAGLKLKRNKCFFLAKSVVYLGHTIDADGLHPTPDKLQAVQDAP